MRRKPFWLKNEIHFGEANFQEAISIEETEINEVVKVVDKVKSLEDAKIIIEGEIKETFKLKNKNFKKVRLLSSLLGYLNDWSEKTGFDFEFNSLGRKVLKQVLSLDAPRLSIVVKANQESVSNSYFDKELILSRLRDDGLCVVYKKDFSPLKKGNVGHSSDVQAFLATLGPLLNNDFEYETCTAQLEEYLEKFNNKVIVIEKGLLESDGDLRRMLDQYDCEYKSGIEKKELKRSKKKSLLLKILIDQFLHLHCNGIWIALKIIISTMQKGGEII